MTYIRDFTVYIYIYIHEIHFDVDGKYYDEHTIHFAGLLSKIV